MRPRHRHLVIPSEGCAAAVVEESVVSFSANNQPQIPPLRFAPVGMTMCSWFGVFTQKVKVCFVWEFPLYNESF